MNPCGAVRYLYLPYGVMNVVKCLSFWWIGTEWYPCQLSSTDLMVFPGTDITIVWGDLVWWGWRGAFLFTGPKSMTRLGDPSGFGVTTIRLHHFAGSFTGTGSSTPSLTSLSRPFFTSSFQWAGTMLGVYAATGVCRGHLPLSMSHENESHASSRNQRSYLW